jgi:oxygen-independent coproporphyrinogen-3 oxidase
VEETIEKFWLARQAGMDNINMDLIIGLPGEGLAQFEHTLRQTEQLMPESLTVHTLSFKRASEMTRNRDAYRVAGRDEVTMMMERAARWTEEHGYVPYYLYRQKNILGNLENVGFALPGKESIYNIIMMEELQSVIGLGCGATSKWVDPATGVISRFANPKEPKAYNENYLRYTEAKLHALNELFRTGESASVAANG